jgi:hypothetical protein
MKSQVKVQIPEPCQQPWEEMTPETGGRHCAACAKTVTDFTRMTDAQILEVMRSSVGGCGRFKADQLNRVLIEPPAEKWFSLNKFYKLAASLLLVFSATKVSARLQVTPHTESVSAEPRQADNLEQEDFRIRFNLTNQLGEPIREALFLFRGESIEREIVDNNGNYSLVLPPATSEEGGVITITHPAHDSTEFYFPKGLTDTPLKIVLPRKNPTTLTWTEGENTIRGTVINSKNGIGIKDALVVLQASRIIVSTDEKGRFELQVPANSKKENPILTITHSEASEAQFPFSSGDFHKEKQLMLLPGSPGFQPIPPTGLIFGRSVLTTENTE